MAALDDLIGHESEFIRQALTFISEDRPLVEECLGLVYLAMQAPSR